MLHRALTAASDGYLLGLAVRRLVTRHFRAGQITFTERGLNPMRHKAVSPDTTHRTIAAFLDVHYAHALSNDVGPLLGRLASLRDEPRVDATTQRQWNKAVSLALTGQATAGRH
jgi:hypothetical protein